MEDFVPVSERYVGEGINRLLNFKITKKDPKRTVTRVFSLANLPEVRAVLFGYRHFVKDTMELSGDLHLGVKFVKGCNDDPR